MVWSRPGASCCGFLRGTGPRPAPAGVPEESWVPGGWEWTDLGFPPFPAASTFPWTPEVWVWQEGSLGGEILQGKFAVGQGMWSWGPAAYVSGPCVLAPTSLPPCARQPI